MKIKDISNFIQGYSNRFKDYFGHLPLHIKQQAQYRASLCEDCLNNGRCKHCGCSTPSMFYSETKVDSENKWQQMLPPDLWNKFIEDNELNIFRGLNQDLPDTKSDISKSEERPDTNSIPFVSLQLSTDKPIPQDTERIHIQEVPRYTNKQRATGQIPSTLINEESKIPSNMGN